MADGESRSSLVWAPGPTEAHSSCLLEVAAAALNCLEPGQGSARSAPPTRSCLMLTTQGGILREEQPAAKGDHSVTMITVGRRQLSPAVHSQRH